MDIGCLLLRAAGLVSCSVLSCNYGSLGGSVSACCFGLGRFSSRCQRSVRLEAYLVGLFIAVKSLRALVWEVAWWVVTLCRSGCSVGVFGV